MALSVWARGDSSSANNASLNASNTNQQPTTLLTFSADTNNDGSDDGDLNLDFTLDGSVDPDTVIYLDTNGDGTLDSGPISFTMEFGGTLPFTNKLNGVGPNNDDLRGQEILILTLDTGERLFFLRDALFDPNDATASQDNFDIMDDFPNGAHDIGGLYVCFVAGTLIAAPTGQIPIEDLRVGDLVLTEHGQSKPIQHTASQTFTAAAIGAFPKLGPIVIPKGAIDGTTPTRDTFVSQNHRILLRDRDLAVLFGLDIAFVAARDLPYARAAAVTDTTYVHILCQDHSVITANGCESETLFPGDVALASMSAQDRATVLDILGPDIDQKTAYPCLTSKEASVWRAAVYSREKRTA